MYEKVKAAFSNLPESQKTEAAKHDVTNFLLARESFRAAVKEHLQNNLNEYVKNLPDAEKIKQLFMPQGENESNEDYAARDAEAHIVLDKIDKRVIDPFAMSGQFWAAADHGSPSFSSVVDNGIITASTIMTNAKAEVNKPTKIAYVSDDLQNQAPAENPKVESPVKLG